MRALGSGTTSLADLEKIKALIQEIENTQQ
jgi:hypothetical protein